MKLFENKSDLSKLSTLSEPFILKFYIENQSEHLSKQTLYHLKLVRQSQIVQSVLQDCQYVLSHLLPECSLLVQGPKIATITVCQDGFKFYRGVLR